MKTLIVLLSLVWHVFPTSSLGQIFPPEPYYLPETQKKDPVVESEFHAYLDSILPLRNDSIVDLDSTKVFKINYISSHSFEYESDFFDSCYIDSLTLICVNNVVKSNESMKIDFIDSDIAHRGATKLNKGLVRLLFSTYKRKESQEPCRAEYSAFISFDGGKHLIISERRFGPDIKGSMPPGYDITYFIELIE